MPLAVVKSLISAFATYSKIPMPNISYKEKDGRFTLIFFPFVGAVIGLLTYGVFLLEWTDSINYYATCVLYMLFPIVITGGIHVDGFMDCMDAIHSYGDREKRLEILKDPHIGAFSVIKLLELAGFWYVGLNIANSWDCVMICFGYVVSRILSAIAIAKYPLAKEDGMLHYTQTHSSPSCVYVLVLELALCYGYLFYEYREYALFPCLAALLCLLLYYFKAKNIFGGTTGDTAGCFLVVTETVWIWSIALGELAIRYF